MILITWQKDHFLTVGYVFFRVTVVAASATAIATTTGVAATGSATEAAFTA